MIRTIAEFAYGESRYIVYRADRAGDELPMHTHTDRGHLTLSMNGEIEAFFPDREPIINKPGDAPLEFGLDRLHGIRARNSGAMFMSVTLTNGAA